MDTTTILVSSLLRLRQMDTTCSGAYFANMLSENWQVSRWEAGKASVIKWWTSSSLSYVTRKQHAVKKRPQNLLNLRLHFVYVATLTLATLGLDQLKHVLLEADMAAVIETIFSI